MTKAVKKIQRKIKRAKKKQQERELKEKIGMFSKLEDSCLVCEKLFDKQDKKMVQSWYVIVNKKKEKVNLYCPECWQRARGLVEKIKEEMNAHKS